MTLDGRVLLLRADASSSMGSGHVMRVLALAEAWRRAGGVATLLSAELPAPLADRARETVTVTRLDARPPGDAADGRETAAQARAVDACAVVVDGYHFTADHLDALAGRPVAAIDDFARLPRYPAAVVLNQNLHADAKAYAGKTAARLLIGPRFALLREAFSAQPPRTRGRARRVLATFGGTDPKGGAFIALDAAQALRSAGLDLDLVVGAANPAAEAIEAMAGPAVRVLRAVRDMDALMREADLMVCAGGTTLWEGCCMGLPMVTLAATPEEDATARKLAAAGAARHLGMMERTDPDDLARAVVALARDEPARGAMAVKARALVDGLGAARVAQAIAESAGLA